jgi:hypothetical protein
LKPLSFEPSEVVSESYGYFFKEILLRPKKSYSQTGRKCRVTFEFHPDGDVQTAYVCGEFNDWNPTSHPLKRRKDGSFAPMLWVEAGWSTRFVLTFLIRSVRATLMRSGLHSCA